MAIVGDFHMARDMEIVRRLGASQTRVSEHMACLTWCGYVAGRVEGRRTFHRARRKHVAGLLATAKRFLQSNEARIASCRVVDR